MLESHPPRSPGTYTGFLAIASLILLDLGLLLFLLTEPITILTFFWGLLLLASLPAVAFVVYWTSALASARYHVDGDSLIIEWGRQRPIVPINQIQGLLSGQVINEVVDFHGVRWPGYYAGRGKVIMHQNSGEVTGPAAQAMEKETLFYASRPPDQQLLLITDSIAYALSPVDGDNFMTCLVALQGIGLAGAGTDRRPATDFVRWRIWRDQTAHLLLVTSILLNGGLFAYLATVYGRLPASVPLHFDRLGEVDRVGPPAALFVLPLAGLISWLLNGLLGWLFYQWRDERPVALVVWSASIVIQLATWMAVFALLTKV